MNFTVMIITPVLTVAYFVLIIQPPVRLILESQSASICFNTVNPRIRTPQGLLAGHLGWVLRIKCSSHFSDCHVTCPGQLAGAGYKFLVLSIITIVNIIAFPLIGPLTLIFAPSHLSPPPTPTQDADPSNSDHHFVTSSLMSRLSDEDPVVLLAVLKLGPQVRLGLYNTGGGGLPPHS